MQESSPLDLTFDAAGLSEPLGNASRVIAAVWAADARGWRRVSHAVLSDPQRISVTLQATGSVSVVRADTAPSAPSLPQVGELLTGVAAQPLPVDASAVLVPAPEVIFLGTSSRSEVLVRLNATSAVPSGTPVRMDVNESYELAGSLLVRPEPMTQELTLYQRPGGNEARFVVTPDGAIAASTLVEGVISVSANRYQDVEDGVALVGPSGGTLWSADGVLLEIPAGALSEKKAVSIRLVAAVEPLLDSSPLLSVIGGVDVDLDGAWLAPAGTLRYSLIEIAKVQGDRITTASPPFCGITSTVQFSVVEATVPLAMASVSVSSSFPGVSTVTIASPSVLLSSHIGGGCNEFAVPVSEVFSGEVHDTTAAELTTVDFGTPDWPVDQIGTIFFPGPKTDPGPFRLVDSVPAAEAQDVPIASPVYLQYSEEVDWTPTVAGCDDHPNDKYCVPVCEVPAPSEHCLCVHATDWPACVSGEARAVRDGLGVLSIVEFKPSRRFELGTEWEVDVEGMRPATMEDVPIDTPAYNVVFRSFEPVVIGTLPLEEEPQDLEVLEDGSIAVAVDPEGEWPETGLAIIDVTDPTAPTVRAQYATRGHANGLTVLPGSGELVLLDASLDHPSRVHIFDSNAVEVGNRRLTASQYAVNTGQTIGPVHEAGWPIDSVVAPLLSGDYAVYVATALIGVQVITATSIRNEDNSTAPGLHAMDIPVALGVLGNNVSPLRMTGPTSARISDK